MDNDVIFFLDLLERASARVARGYFRLEVAGINSGMFRERVYAYELYHQLRCIWPNRDEWHFVLNGEVDKRGHPLPQMQGPFVHNRIPDLLVHRPGDMEGNLVIIEIKAASSNEDEIRQDIQKLSAFCTDPGYHAGVLLLIGKASDRHALLTCIRASIADGVPTDKQERILIYEHQQAEQPAQRVF